MAQDLKTIRESLSKMVADLKLKEVAKDKDTIVRQTTNEVIRVFQPLFSGLIENSKISKEEIKSLAEEIAAKINIPEIKIPEILLPQINVPETRIPEFKIPEPKVTVNVPEPKVMMPERLSVSMDEVTRNNPMPVRLMDEGGKPFAFTVPGAGGKADYFTIKGFSQSAFSELINPDGRVKVELPSGSSGLTDAELRAAHLDVLQLSGSVDSVWVTGSSVSLSATIIDSGGVGYSGSNPLPVTLVSGGTATSGVNVVDSSGEAYSGSNPMPTYVATTPTYSMGATILNGEGLARDSWLVSGITNTIGVYNLNSAGDYKDTYPVSGSVAVSGITGSIGATILNGEGLARDSWLVSDITNSLKSALIDSTGVQYSGSNPVPITIISTAASGATGSMAVSVIGSDGLAFGTSKPLPVTYVAGVSASGAASIVDSGGVQYSGSNPVPITIISTVSGGATGSMAVSIIGSDGLAFGTSKPVPVTMVAGVSGTTGSSLVDSGGVQYSGSNPVPVYTVANTASSTAVVGPVVSDAADDGSAPIKVGGIARNANPSAVANGDTVSFTADTLGRQVMRPIQVRDLIATASATMDTNTANDTLLRTGIASTKLDLLQVVASNYSTKSVAIYISQNHGGTAMVQLSIPAEGTVGFVAQVPVPMDEAANGWYMDWDANPNISDRRDVTNTVVKVSALFSKEI